MASPPPGAASPTTLTRRSRIGLALGVLGVGAGLVAWNLVRGPRTGRCEAEAAEIDEVWSESARATLEEQLNANEGAAAAVVQAIDRYASDWKTGMEATCGDSTAASSTVAVRRRCLQRRRASLGAWLTALGQADARTRTWGVEAVLALPSIAACSDPRALESALASPDDPGLAEGIEAIRGQLDAIDAELALHRPQAALASATELAPIVDPHGDALAGEVWLRIARARLASDAEEAYAAYERALWHAVASGHGTVEFEAALGLAEIEPDLAARDRWWQHAGAVAKRFGMPTEIEAQLLETGARLQRNRGEFEPATRSLEQALTLREQLVGTDSEALVATCEALAETYAMAGDLPRARTMHGRVTTIVRDRYGGGHPRLAVANARFGRVLARHGQGDAALEHLQAAARLFPADDPERVDALLELGHQHSAALRHQAAYEAFDDALRTADGVGAATEVRTAAAIGAATALGALQQWDRALEIVSATRSKVAASEIAATVDLLGAEADALEGLGRNDDAGARLQERVAILRNRTPADPPALVEALAQLADFDMRSGRPEAALDAAGQALEVLAEGGELNGTAAVQTLMQLGAATLELGRPKDASAAFERAVGVAQDSQLPAAEAAAMLGWASAKWAADERSQALTIARALLDDLQARPRQGEVTADDVRQWLERRTKPNP